MEETRRVMICRKVVGADGVARVVLQPAENVPAATQTNRPIIHDDNPLGEDSPSHVECGKKTPKPFIQCEICGKKFYVTDTTYRRTPKERLTLHIVTEHDKERLYECNVEGCFKAYNNIKQLNQHKLVHTNRKNHKCPQCPKRFHRKTHLLAHMRRHNANPNFKPRASRRQCNPYIQVQRKKNSQSTEDVSETPSAVTANVGPTTTYQVIEAGAATAAGPGTTVVVVTEEELEQMRRLDPDAIDREAILAYGVVEADDVQTEEAELDDAVDGHEDEGTEEPQPAAEEEQTGVLEGLTLVR